MRRRGERRASQCHVAAPRPCTWPCDGGEKTRDLSHQNDSSSEFSCSSAAELQHCDLQSEFSEGSLDSSPKACTYGSSLWWSHVQANRLASLGIAQTRGS